MRYLLLLLMAAQPVLAADTFPLTAGDGSRILSPTDKTTAEVSEGDRKVQVPAGMVYIPAGRFTFGRTEQAELPAFCIGRFEVTNAEYKAFLDATKDRGTPRYWREGTFPEGKANHPVLFVSLDDAEAYSKWVSEQTGWNVVVPTAEQWEKAARGPEAFSYPWGNEKHSRFKDGHLEARFNYNAVCAAHYLLKEPKTRTQYTDKSSRAGEWCTVDEIVGGRGQRFGVTDDGNVNGWIDHTTNTGFVNTKLYRDLVNQGGYTTPVGSFPAGVSHYGCHDLAGNAYEWTASVIIATNGAERGREVNDVRGGSWYSMGRSGMSLCTGEGRQRRGAYHSVGFRIAMNPASP
ncbi:MAG: SUMF1/EgtB/PvdO family nonheme iron enzyme [Planctomycetaceae bacterium]